ncbi:hypothetical protein ACFW5K_25205 [Streptomyces albidoflavus]
MRTTHCQHGPCGRELPPGGDRRKRFCGDACRKAANRAEKAAESGRLATVHPITPEPADGRSALADDVLTLWSAFMHHVTTDGLVVMGSAGVPVAHPLLRSFTGLYAAVKEQTGSAPDESADDDEKVLAAAMRRVRQIQQEEAAAWTS